MSPVFVVSDDKVSTVDTHLVFVYEVQSNDIVTNIGDKEREFV